MEVEKWSVREDGGANDGACSIVEEVPRVLRPERRIKFRSFTSSKDYWMTGNALDDSAFRTFKRRRLDASLLEKSEQSGDSYHHALLRRLVGPFEISQRQYQTFQWLRDSLELRNLHPDEITARFALDRSLGAPPCLGAVNAALEVLGREGGIRKEATAHLSVGDHRESCIDAILDIVEDILLDGSPVALSTVEKAAMGLASHPVRACRVVFALSSRLKEPLSSIPVKVWQELCNGLADHCASLATPSTLEAPPSTDVMERFGELVRLINKQDGALSESVIAKFGVAALELNPGYLVPAMELVEQEILSGHSDADESGNPVRLSAFLSKILCMGCDSAARRREDTGSEHHHAFPKRMIELSGDVIKFAYARQMQLMNTALDAVLELCDEQTEYFRLCIFFSAMCVLSTPTLRSLLRFVEVLHDVPTLRGQTLYHILKGTTPAFLVWVLQKFGRAFWEESRRDKKTTAAYSRVLELVGIIFCEEKQPRMMVKLFFELKDYAMHSACVPVCSYYARLRGKWASGEITLDGVVSSAASAMEVIEEELISILLGGTPGNSLRSKKEERPSGSVPTTTTTTLTRPSTVAALLQQRWVSNPQMYCSIVTTSCLNALAGNKNFEHAFARMMAEYRSRSGATVLLPLDSVTPDAGLTAEGRQLAARWHHQDEGSSWFVVLPLSISSKLEGRVGTLDMSFHLFSTIQQSGHKRVMLIGGTAEEVQMAKEASLNPVVLISDLMKKLRA